MATALFRMQARTGHIIRDGRCVSTALHWPELEAFMGGVREAFLALGHTLEGPIVDPDDIERWDNAHFETARKAFAAMPHGGQPFLPATVEDPA